MAAAVAALLRYLVAAGTLSCERRFTDEVAIETCEESVMRVRHITVANALMRQGELGRTLLRVRRPAQARQTHCICQPHGV